MSRLGLWSSGRIGPIGSLAAIAASLILLAAPGIASADPQYSVMNAPEGVFWRSEPNWASAEQTVGFGVYDGTIIEVHCYQSGTTVEGSEDTMWEYATDVGGRGYGSGWLNEHFINDERQINEPSPGVGPCQGAPVVTVSTPMSPPSTPPPTSTPSTPAPSPAPPATAAPKPTCYGDYCSGKDPGKTHCATDGKMITEIPKGPEGDFSLELVWSATCKTKWARVFLPRGLAAPSRLGVEQSTGYTQEGGFGGWYGKKTEVVSPMIYSPVKCVKAFYVPEPGYKWNLEETKCK